MGGLGYGKGRQGPCFPKERLSRYQKQCLSLSAVAIFSGLLNPYLNQGANFSLGEAPVCTFGVVRWEFLYFLAHGLIKILPGV